MLKQTLQKALIIPRIKAFITDLFMIYTPILYIMTYFVLGGKNSFQNNQIAISICLLLYGIISASFLSAKTQTPGFRFSQIKLVSLDNQPIGFFRAFLRFLLWIASMALVVGFVYPFFDKKSRCLHDLICHTQVLPTTPQN